MIWSVLVLRIQIKSGAILHYVDYEWDQEKAATNLNKHGVSFEEAASVFGDEEE